MSLVTIYENRDYIKKTFEKIKYKNYESAEEYLSKVISNCLCYQYEMMRKYLNANAINKRHFESDLKGNELLDAWYQHIFMHNYTALNDEYFEVYDALNKVNKNETLLDLELNKYDAVTIEREENVEKNRQKIIMSSLLVTEELIDVFHFLLEYAILEKEAYLISFADERNITVKNLEYFFIDCADDNEFYSNMKILLEKEAAHIATFILDENNQELFLKSVGDGPENILFYNTKINRDLIRETNFKDWKKYDFKQFYSQLRFSNIFIYVRNLFLGFHLMIGDFTGEFNTVNSEILELERNDSESYMNIDDSQSINDVVNENYKRIYATVYAIYLAKRAENIRRQGNGDKTKADPRYYSDGTGKIVGNSCL